VLADAGDQDVGKTVIVIVADSYAHAIDLDVETCLAGYVGEAPIAIIAVKPQRTALAFMPRPIHPIDQENVLPAVTVVVQESAAGTERLRKKLSPIRSTVVVKLNARSSGNVYQAETWGRSLWSRRRPCVPALPTGGGCESNQACKE